MLAWMRRRCAGGITILMYHRVLPVEVAPAYPFPNLVVDVPTFEQQMEWLARNFRVLPLREAVAALEGAQGGGLGGARPVACVTFDDGYRDNADHAAPVLERHGLRGTFFVTTGFVEGMPMWFDVAGAAWRRDPVGALQRAASAAPEAREALGRIASLDVWMGTLKKLPVALRGAVVASLGAEAPGGDYVFAPMTPEQVRHLAQRGHEIASHAVTHPILPSLDDAALRYELRQSGDTLRRWTGGPVNGFCYPNGNHDERVVRAARAEGYAYACAVRRGIARSDSERMALPRRSIGAPKRLSRALDRFESEVVGWRDLVHEGSQMVRKLRGAR